MSNLTTSTFMPPKKEVVCNWLKEAVDIMLKQSAVVDQLKDIVEQFKTDTLADTGKIIKLQEKLLENKDEQIRTLESSVEKTVHNTV